ncbi:IS1634 family transposase [uncultured Alistipes sp.]|uniref:IS1634 family transposase n=1 Tax=uncultured Alistipes sp. TaxID=538949 RepID=UPI003209A3CA
MILRKINFGKEPVYYVQKSYRKEDGRPATKNVERLGTINELKKRFGDEDPIEEAKKYIARLTEEEREARRKVVVEYSPTAMLKKGEQRSYNGGYLFLQKIYYELGLDYICRKIEKKHRNKFDLNGILSRLLYTRLLYPGSKLSSLEDSRRFIEQPQEDIHQVYRALSMLAGEFNEIQADVYRRSLKIGKRDTGVVYYDLTNYFFEWEEEGGLVQYGHSKEGRPLPIVQMGLFVDREGFPLAMCIEPGNKAESATLKPMEEILKEKFGLSRIIVCTDAGLSTYENRKNDAVSERSFITVQSVKKMGGTLQDWALSDEGWSVPGSDRKYNLAEVNRGEYYDTLFYKERWDQVRMSTGEILEQRYIVTFSFKYRDYLSYVRQRQIARAQALLDSGRATVSKRKSPNDAKRFIKAEYCTEDGELAQVESFSLNQEMIEQEARFDGFYCICTDLNAPTEEVIRLNGGRWIVENDFRMTKTEMEARPVYLKRDDRIKAHFLTCFLALLIYRYLEKKVNRGGMHFTSREILGTLRDMNFLCINGEGYIPTYTRTDLTNHLHGSAGFRTDTQIVTKKAMRSIIASTKKREKEADGE